MLKLSIMMLRNTVPGKVFTITQKMVVHLPLQNSQSTLTVGNLKMMARFSPLWKNNRPRQKLRDHNIGD